MNHQDSHSSEIWNHCQMRYQLLTLMLSLSSHRSFDLSSHFKHFIFVFVAMSTFFNPLNLGRYTAKAILVFSLIISLILSLRREVRVRENP